MRKLCIERPKACLTVVLVLALVALVLVDVDHNDGSSISQPLGTEVDC